MNNTIKRPIKKSLVAGCILFVAILSLVLFVVNYSGYKQTLYRNYENYIEKVLDYTAAHIDTDDLKECIDMNIESQKYKDLQTFLDDVKEDMKIDYLYVIVPLSTSGDDCIKNVIAGATHEEYENNSDSLVHLNQLSDNSYTPSTSKKYFDAFHSGELSFFEKAAQWGNEYTGLLPLYDSKGELVAALCVDVDIQAIHTQLYSQTFYVIMVTIIVGALFTVLFIYWAKTNISQPIQELERAVTGFAKISHLHQSPEDLVLEVPEIQTENEVESLSNAVVKMSEDIRDYAQGIADAEEESKRQSIALGEALTAAQEANRAKTAFLSNMSHEIRTPMNAIIGLDNIALNDPDLSASTRDYLEKIGTSAQHLLSIINDILDMSRIESGRMAIKSEEFSFAKALEQVNTIIGGQCRDKGLTYECNIIGDIDDYYIGDDMKLRQIMINILGNSVKFTPKGGAVSFTVERIAQYHKNATLRFKISDTGIGMSPEFLPKIFESFSQEDANASSQYGTTGLGMAITKNLIELMYGDIAVESEKGVGTTFTVTLTLKESDRKAEIDDFGIHPGDLSILVIDPDAVACDHAAGVLSQSGACCDTARTAAEAVGMIRLRSARREPYDLIMIDWRAAGAGASEAAAIRELTGSESIIFMVISYYCDETVTDADRSVIDGYLHKPLFSAAVITEFKTAYRRRNSDHKPRRTDLSGRRILIAEDVAINAEILQMLLEARGMTVEVAENGEIAVDMVESHPERYYDAILMDMRMPVMDGLEAAGAIRAMNRPDSKTIPIIALTANAFDEDVQRSLQAGLNAHLSKPVEPQSLYETLETLIKDK